MTASVKEQLLQLTVAVETALSASDYRAYRRYVEPGASFFEPRSRGALMQGAEGEAFEKFYFDHAASPPTIRFQHRVNVVDPCIHILDDDGRSAYVAYVSSRQSVDPVSGRPVTTKSFVTRLWVRRDNGDWRNVHFHRE